MQQKHLNFFADFLLDLGGAVLYSIGIGLFAQNAGFAPGGQLTTTGRENVKTVSPSRLVTLMSSPWEQIMVFTI